VAGSVTSLGSGSPAYVSSVGDVFKFVVNGSSLELFVNGASKVAVTDTSHATGQYVGLGSENTNVRWDDFSAADLGAPPATFTGWGQPI